MGKGEELTTTKYLIHAQITANGIVEKPDVVGGLGANGEKRGRAVGATVNKNGYGLGVGIFP